MAACLMLVLRLLVIRLFPGRVVGFLRVGLLGRVLSGRFIRRLMRRAGGFLRIGTLRLGTWMRVWVLRRLRRVGAILARLVICGRAWWIGGSVTIFPRRVFLLAAG